LKASSFREPDILFVHGIMKEALIRGPEGGASFSGVGSTNSEAASGGRQEPVYLHVYDLVEHNTYMYWAGIGVYHSGVEVYGREYAYGGHEYESPGIFATAPGMAPGAVVHREKILVGYTNLSESQIFGVLKELGSMFRGNRYHLLQMNCNTFSSQLCHRLTGKRAPGWINRLADLAVSLNCLLPQGWLPPLRPPMGTEEDLLINDSNFRQERART
jgi:hypothetical protein